VLAKEMSRF